MLYHKVSYKKCKATYTWVNTVISLAWKYQPLPWQNTVHSNWCYLLQFMLGKLFAVGEAPMKQRCLCLCLCVCVCVCVCTHLNMDDVEVERDHDTRKSSPRRAALLLSRMACVTSRGKRQVSTLRHTNLWMYLSCTSLFASFILLKFIRIKTIVVNALQPVNTAEQHPYTHLFTHSLNHFC
jgi:hypothetical protein